MTSINDLFAEPDHDPKSPNSMYGFVKFKLDQIKNKSTIMDNKDCSMNLCKISIDNGIQENTQWGNCECGKILENYSSNEILSLFCEIFQFKICKISYDIQNQIWNKSFFGPNEYVKSIYILELSTFPTHIFLFKEKLQMLLKQKEKKNFEFKLILKIKNSLERLNKIITNHKNYFYFKILAKSDSDIKGNESIYFILVLKTRILILSISLLC